MNIYRIKRKCQWRMPDGTETDIVDLNSEM